jgi:uncharacterized membrane protein
MLNWIHAGPTLLASFLASFVEFVEALTVVLAVGIVRGWKPAIAGTVCALAVLLAMVAVFGQTLAQVPLPLIQLAVGALLLLFGLRWLRKAILRGAGIIALHDEGAAFARESAALRLGKLAGRWDAVAFFSAFKIVMLEGVEVVFIVIAMGHGDLLRPACAGALAALLVVTVLGIVLHKPLTAIPENTLKFCVGVLIAAFGTFWTGEGLGLTWPGADWALLALVPAYAAVALLLRSACRRARAAAQNRPAKAKAKAKAKAQATLQAGTAAVPVWLRGLFSEVAGLFVDDGLLAAGSVLWIAAAGLPGALGHDSGAAAGVLFFAGFAILLGLSALRAARA